MNFRIYTFNKFYPICILKLQKIRKCKQITYNISKIQLQITLAGLGSLTRYYQYLSSKSTWVSKLQSENSKKVLESRKIRCVWIKQNLYTQIAFARSLWKTIFSTSNQFGKISQLPIGISLIKNKEDTKRIIHEIYYGYCKTIESMNSNTIMLSGRKCTLYYKNRHYITIQEFFPNIKNIN